MTNGSPAPVRAFCCRARMLARVSKPTEPRGLVASHSRIQDRPSTSSRSLERASRRRMGRMPTLPERRVGTGTTMRSVEAGGELDEPGPQLRPQVLALGGELHDRLDVVDLVARVVAAAAEDDAVDAAGPGGAGHLLQRVGQLDLAALAWSRVLEDREDLRLQ